MTGSKGLEANQDSISESPSTVDWEDESGFDVLVGYPHEPSGILSPSLEAILDKIGWATVKKSDRQFAWRHALVLTPGANGSVPDTRYARAVVGRFSKLAAAIDKIVVELGRLPPGQRDVLNDNCHHLDRDPSSDERELFEDIPDHVETTREALVRLRAGLVARSKFHADVEGASKRKRNEWAYQIASTLAEIYVVGRGEMPTYGRDANTGEPNGDFARVVQEVYRELELDVKDPIPQCKAARDLLTEPWFEFLLAFSRGKDPEAKQAWLNRWGTSAFR